MARPWRLLLDPAGPGPWNMAVDEVLLASAAAGGPATLRCCRWDGPWLSLGYGQQLPVERRAACAAVGVGWVRRVTGGGAVLHGSDLTYAIAAPARALPPGLEASYGLVADALVAALAALGLSVHRAAPDRGPAPRAFDCFGTPAQHEICAAGRKLVGSAQRRAGGALLQHGSIRLRPDPPEAVRAAGLNPARATSLAELGWGGDPDRLAEAIRGALATSLAASLEPGALAPAERSALRRRLGPLACGEKKFPRTAGLQLSSALLGRR